MNQSIEARFSGSRARELNIWLIAKEGNKVQLCLPKIGGHCFLVGGRLPSTHRLKQLREDPEIRILGTFNSWKVLGRRFCGCVQVCPNSCISINKSRKADEDSGDGRWGVSLAICLGLAWVSSKRCGCMERPTNPVVPPVCDCRGDDPERSCCPGVKDMFWARSGTLCLSWW